MSNEAWAYVATLDHLGEAESVGARFLLAIIAQNTWNDTFVCRLCQEQMAYEAGRMGLRTVQRHLAALETARVVIRSKRRSDASGQSLPDLVRIVGFKRWYHRDHAPAIKRWRDAEPPRVKSWKAAKPPAKLAGGSEAKSSTATRQIGGWPPANLAAGHPPTVAAGHPPLLAGPYKDSFPSLLPSESEERTPLPPTGEDAGRGKAGRTDRALKVRGPDWERLLANLRTSDAGRNLALDLLVAPVIAVRKLDAPTASPALRAVLDLAAAKGLGETGLKLAATVLLGRRAVTVKPADFEAAILTAHGATVARPVRPAIRIVPSSPAWGTWLHLIAARDGADAAAAIETAGELWTETRWPVEGQHAPVGTGQPKAQATSEASP